GSVEGVGIGISCRSRPVSVSQIMTAVPRTVKATMIWPSGVIPASRQPRGSVRMALGRGGTFQATTIAATRAKIAATQAPRLIDRGRRGAGRLGRGRLSEVVATPPPAPEGGRGKRQQERRPAERR